MKKLISIFITCVLLLHLGCNVKAASLQGDIGVFDEDGDLQMWYKKMVTVIRCIDKESGEVIQLDRTYFYPNDPIISDFDDETRNIIFSDMNDEFLLVIELKSNDENNPYPEVEPFKVHISNSGMFESPERNELFGKDYRVYYLEDAILKEIEITNGNDSGLDFKAEKLGVYIIYYNPNVHNVKFYTDETLEEEYCEIKDLKYHSAFDFPELPTKEGYVFTGWKHFHWLKKYDAYLTFDRAVVPHAWNVYASWCPEEEYAPLKVTIESEKKITKGKEDGSEITLTLSEGKFDDVISWYPNVKWKIVGNDELSIASVERIDDTTAKLTLAGNSSDKYTDGEIQIEFDSSYYVSHGEFGDNYEVHEIADIQLDENGIKRKMFITDNSITLEKQKKSNGGSGVTYYTVLFDTNGGENIASERVKRGGIVTQTETPVKEGYIFEGWYTDEELTQRYDFSSKITGNLTLYAAWEEDNTADVENKNVIVPIKIIGTILEQIMKLMNSVTE